MSIAGKLLVGTLLLCLPLQVMGWDWHTRVTVVLKDQPLLEICRLLEKGYGIPFSYSREIVNLSRKVSIEAYDRPLRQVLESVFVPNNIAFKRIGDQIVLTLRKSQGVTYSGYVEDVNSGEKLIGATIYCPSLQLGTTSNAFGFFSLTLPADTARVWASYIGYQPVELITKTKQGIIVSLGPLASLKEIVISEALQPHLQQQTQMSKIGIPTAEVKSMPKFLGEADILRTIQSLPGVSGGMDGVGGINVRGGSPDQNLILLDGTPVFNSTHLLGIFSVFNADAVKNTDLYKGAFPARFGGRLSSVIDIAMKDGDMKEYHGEVALGLIAAKMMVEGPIKKEKTSFMVSARRSYTDLLMNQLVWNNTNTDDGYIGAYFFDANIKVNHIFSPKDRLYFSAYGGQDKLKLNTAERGNNLPGGSGYKENAGIRLKWGNVTAALRWNHVFHPKLFSNVTLNYSQYYFQTDYEYKYSSVDLNEISNQYGQYYSQIQNALAKIDFDYRPHPKHSIRFGGGVITHIFTPGVSLFKSQQQANYPQDTMMSNAKTVGVEMSVYAEDDWELLKHLHVNLGLHLSSFLVEGRFYSSLQPRLGARFQMPANWALKLAYTHMNQYIHLLTNNGTMLPTDLWVPSTPRVMPMFSRQLAIGAAKTSTNGMFEYSLEGYYKTMDHVIEYRDDLSFFSTGSGSGAKRWDERVAIGHGWAYGGELLLRKKKGNFRGWIGYTLAWSERQFNDVNKGRKFPYKYDRRHELELVLIQRLGKHWEASASWSYSTGLPVTLAIGSYEGISEPSPHTPVETPGRVDYMGERNSFRTQDIHRLDISFTYTKQKKWWVKSWNFSLFNAYNRRNPFFLYMKKDEEKKQRYLTQFSILPILPSVTYSIKF
ncbi:TonB-dependent receptor [Chitinophaga pendula]|uniref:TonB-dependent receptor n=1 Tax=Chitinophaga TaxID=79328 RepID=UPI000BAF00B9|nr:MULTISPECIES: TonB-dependent receptor [Chitinophaga]ASZ09737.1 TonB-dependent receptor [Chitinophaga sp. MD30]UCJ07320.1 TonB-dependent receptor [Chitinophaga pendula]